jgi:hypothetical protein
MLSVKLTETPPDFYKWFYYTLFLFVLQRCAMNGRPVQYFFRYRCILKRNLDELFYLKKRKYTI